MNFAQLKNHPAASIFPRMAEMEFDKFKADIAANGVREPIWLCDNMVLDGRHRVAACADLGIDPPVREYTGDDPAGFVVSLNLHRRHLDASQRAMVAAKLATLRHGGDRKSHQAANWPLETQATAAELLNVGERSVRRAREVLDEGVPELIDAVEQGKIAVSAAAMIAQQPPAEQVEAMSKPRRHIIPQTTDMVPESDLADDLAEALKTIRELAEENESLCLSAQPETEHIAKIRSLEAELRVTRQSRDSLMRENAALKRQCEAQQRKIKALTK